MPPCIFATVYIHPPTVLVRNLERICERERGRLRGADGGAMPHNET